MSCNLFNLWDDSATLDTAPYLSNPSRASKRNAAMSCFSNGLQLALYVIHSRTADRSKLSSVFLCLWLDNLRYPSSFQARQGIFKPLQSSCRLMQTSPSESSLYERQVLESCDFTEPNSQTIGPSHCWKNLLAGCSKDLRAEARDKSTNGGVLSGYVEVRRLGATMDMSLSAAC